MCVPAFSSAWGLTTWDAIYGVWSLGISVQNAALARSILYGWDILLAGTAWPGRRIGAGNEAVIREAAQHHEVGLHAWDHHAWQAWAGVWDIPRLSREVERGMLELEAITGQPVRCSAVAGWRADQRVVKAKEAFAFRYNSDCRGTGPFCRC